MIKAHRTSNGRRSTLNGGDAAKEVRWRSYLGMSPGLAAVGVDDGLA